MSKKKAWVFAFSTVSAVLAQACNYYEEKPLVDSFNSAALAGQVSYAMVKEKVFAPSCIKCHGNKGDVNLESYAAAASAASSINTSVFATRKMPKDNPPLTSEQMGILKAWLDAGAPELAGNRGNAVTPAPSASPIAPLPNVAIADLSYANVNAKVIQTNCIDCHKNGIGVDLQSYESLKENASRISLAVFSDDRTMPPKKKTQLTNEQASLLKAWIMTGAPENAPAQAELIQPNYESIRRNVFEPLCLSCHGAGRLAKQKPLAPFSALMDKSIRDNDTVEPNKPDDSSLMDVIGKPENDEDRMPPQRTHLKPLSPETVEIIRHWIELGAPEK